VSSETYIRRRLAKAATITREAAADEVLVPGLVKMWTETIQTEAEEKGYRLDPERKPSSRLAEGDLLRNECRLLVEVPVLLTERQDLVARLESAEAELPYVTECRDRLAADKETPASILESAEDEVQFWQEQVADCKAAIALLD
jgi:hypothetical protein